MFWLTFSDITMSTFNRLLVPVVGTHAPIYTTCFMLNVTHFKCADKCLGAGGFFAANSFLIIYGAK